MKSLSKSILAKTPILIEKLVEKCHIDEKDVPIAFEELLKYLFVNAKSEKKLTPSIRIDDIWHEFILFTKLYANFCEKEYGFFIHHRPGGSEEENINQYKETLNELEKQFGSLNEHFWPIPGRFCEHSNCGSCD